MKHGYYKWMGNTIEYWGGDYAYDLDAGQDIPKEALFGATYLGKEL